MPTSSHPCNKNILVLGEDLIKELHNLTMIAEVKYPVNFTQLGRQFVLTPHYNGSNGSLFVNAAEIFEFKAKDFEIKPYLLF